MILHRLLLLLMVGVRLQSSQQDQTILATDQSVTGCTVGAYRVLSEPFNGCSGWRWCGVGHYCADGARRDCPPGAYGASETLSTSKCSGLCSAGYWCQSRSTSQTENKCGNYTHYCPAGSAAPLAAPAGFYTTKGAEVTSDVETRTSILICPRGYYCTDGLRKLCPAGTYGSTEGLASGTCSGECAAGWFCPAGSTSPKQEPCGMEPTRYCPAGSGRRLPVAEAFYADSFSDAGTGDVGDGGFAEQHSCPAGSYCIYGVRRPCPAGRFGSKTLETNASCSGECMAGHYCPEGSISPKQHPCGPADVFCPARSAEPTAVSGGHYTFSHLNEELFDDPAFNNYANTSHRHNHKALRQTGERVCEAGHFCTGDGFRLPCPAGRYGAAQGETSSQCSGPCAEGFYCPLPGSVSPTAEICADPNTFCMTGSVTPHVVSPGYYSLLGAEVGGSAGRAFEHKCEPGFYCSGGERLRCPKGVYGGSFGLTNESCSGKCSEGYFCPAGSLSSTEVECGNHNLYCPGGGNWMPTRVSVGYFTTGGNVSTRTGQAVAPAGSYAADGLLFTCRAGYYGAAAGLSSSVCSGPCNVPGYYCPAGSTSPTMRVCGGDNMMCPPMSTAPIKVLSGYYTTDYTHEGCKPGYFRNWTLSSDASHRVNSYNSSLLATPAVSGEPTDLLPSQMATPPCQLCPDGTFKSVKGDSFSLCRSCNYTLQNKLAVSSDDRTTCECSKAVADPDDYIYHFSITTGKCVLYTIEDFSLVDASLLSINTSLTRYKQMECEAGYYCLVGERFICPPGRYGSSTRETNSSCSGECAAGYFCPAGSTSAYQNVCGARNRICPAGSQAPQTAPAGSYTDGDTSALLQVSLTTCEPGFYCPGDGSRYECKPGFYGDSYGLSSAECSGQCRSGHYCGSASSTPTHYRCGNSSVYCPRGSAAPKAVHAGFYSINTGDATAADQLWDDGNATRSAEIPCEPGYYCTAGVKQPCPPGTFGWRYGMASRRDCQLCAKGHYCPSYLQPQPDAPGHTVWPGKPHTKADEFECGSVGYYCPGRHTDHVNMYVQ